MDETKLTYSETKILVKLRDEFMLALNKWDGVKWKDWHADMLFDQLMRAYIAGSRVNYDNKKLASDAQNVGD